MSAPHLQSPHLQSPQKTSLVSRLLATRSIKTKLISIIMVVSSIGIILAGVSLVVYERYTFGQDMITKMTTLAGVIADNSQSAVAFNDSVDASRVLSSLASEPAIISAAIYSKNDQLLANYFRDPSHRAIKGGKDRLPADDTFHFTDEFSVVTKPVMLDQQVIGNVYLSSDHSELNRLLKRLIITVLIILLVVESFAYLLASRLQNYVSQPLLSLAQTTRKISQQQNYGLRASKQSDDELGNLTDDLNALLEQIEQTESLLKQANDELEFNVVERTKALSKSNQQLLKSKDKAEAASRAKSEFLANMSHEIRTPMNSVMGFTDLLYDTPLSAKQKTFLQSIQSGANGLMTIINDVLDLSKIEAGKLALQYEAVETRAFINDVEQLLAQGASDKGLDFDVIIDADLPQSLLFDQTRVRQILFNLLSNAIKFTAAGYIRLIVSHVNNSQYSNNKCGDTQPNTIDLSIAVQDTGIGVKADQTERIFEQFTQQEGQSTRKFGGTGLGLTICSKLAKMMGGTITVSSEEGKGSIFTLHLAKLAVTTLEQPDSANDNDADEVIFAAENVLLVDDIKANRLLVKEQFSDSNIIFSEAENGLEAIEVAKQTKPQLIIMDMRMPIMNGATACKQLKEDQQTRHIPIVALTASIVKSTEISAEQRDFDAFLHKPTSRKTINNIFKRYLKYQVGVAVEESNSIIAIEETLSLAEGKMLLSQLNTQANALFLQAQSSGLMDDITQLIGELNRIGSQFEAKKVLDYTQALDNAAQLFDIKRIEELMLEFRALVSYYKAFVTIKTKQH